MQDMFKQNPAKTGMIFDKSHPYFKVASEDREFARQNFGLPIPPTDSTPSNFVPLNSISEVENFIKTNGIAENVSLLGANLEAANVMAETLSDLTQEFKITKLEKLNNSIKSTSKQAAHANATLIEYNKTYIGAKYNKYEFDNKYKDKVQLNLQTFYKLKEEKPHLFEGVGKNAKHNRKALKTLEQNVKFERWTTASGDIARTTTHEFAHVLEMQYLNVYNGFGASRAYAKSHLAEGVAQNLINEYDKFYKEFMKSEDRFKISAYAMSNKNELWAEMFTMYRFERTKLPQKALEFMEFALNEIKTKSKLN
jgi:hypothetical protein